MDGSGGLKFSGNLLFSENVVCQSQHFFLKSVGFFIGSDQQMYSYFRGKKGVPQT